MVDWQSRLSADSANTKNTPTSLSLLFFIVVSNAWDQDVEVGHGLSLPFSAFPLVDIVFTSPGVMEWD